MAARIKCMIYCNVDRFTKAGNARYSYYDVVTKEETSFQFVTASEELYDMTFDKNTDGNLFGS